MRFNQKMTSPFIPRLENIPCRVTALLLAARLQICICICICITRDLIYALCLSIAAIISYPAIGFL